MKKMVCTDNDGAKFILNEEDVKDFLYCDDLIEIDIPNLVDCNVDYLINKLNKNKSSENDTIEKIEETLIMNNIEFDGVDYMKDYEEFERVDKLVYNTSNDEFENIISYNDYTIQGYEYWNGSNWNIKLFDDVEKIEITQENVSLDVYDGRNYNIKVQGVHQDLYKITNDNDNFIGEFLIIKYSQYQGNIDKPIFINNLDDLTGYLYNVLNYDDDEVNSIIQEIDSVF